MRVDHARARAAQPLCRRPRLRRRGPIGRLIAMRPSTVMASNRPASGFKHGDRAQTRTKRIRRRRAPRPLPVAVGWASGVVADARSEPAWGQRQGHAGRARYSHTLTAARLRMDLATKSPHQFAGCTRRRRRLISRASGTPGIPLSREIVVSSTTRCPREDSNLGLAILGNRCQVHEQTCQVLGRAAGWASRFGTRRQWLRLRDRARVLTYAAAG